VIHRDLRPANILINREGVAKVTDFGTSRILEMQRDGYARTRIGSPPYMAPEHFRGRAVFQSDLWSLGITFYEMLTGGVPFYDADPIKIAQSFQNTPVVPPHLRNAKVPRPLSEAVMKALAVNLGDRYLSAQDFFNALKALREGMVRETRPIPPASFTTPGPARPGLGNTQQKLCRFCFRPLPRMAVACPSCGEKNL
jgi:serine/threonine protein kinase